ncbi:hypothetical protein K443DRAFT_407653 [Laccaria amethystina LaAM-08-1]|uniref:Uncharacterized protein n=1 Tax=Laccaria amethystina LaAM-08-1 TaxID=1095629 RepID=A0A0C9WQ76_9AGAR|nr:hypothetical protein K443DRAFT_407653 [Laccaria amethystina LaAM-08-1]
MLKVQWVFRAAGGGTSFLLRIRSSFEVCTDRRRLNSSWRGRFTLRGSSSCPLFPASTSVHSSALPSNLRPPSLLRFISALKGVYDYDLFLRHTCALYISHDNCRRPASLRLWLVTLHWHPVIFRLIAPPVSHSASPEPLHPIQFSHPSRVFPPGEVDF